MLGTAGSLNAEYRNDLKAVFYIFGQSVYFSSSLFSLNIHNKNYINSSLPTIDYFPERKLFDLKLDHKKQAKYNKQFSDVKTSVLNVFSPPTSVRYIITRKTTISGRN